MKVNSQFFQVAGEVFDGRQKQPCPGNLRVVWQGVLDPLATSLPAGTPRGLPAAGWRLCGSVCSVHASGAGRPPHANPGRPATGSTEGGTDSLCRLSLAFGRDGSSDFLMATLPDRAWEDAEEQAVSAAPHLIQWQNVRRIGHFASDFFARAVENDRG
jgi:hypothetical protein